MPEIHCRLEIVGLGGISAWTLKILSAERGLQSVSCVLVQEQISSTYNSSPVPQTFKTAISEGPTHPKTSPVGVMIASDNRFISRMWLILALPISFNAGMVYDLAFPSPNRPTKLVPRPSYLTTAAESHKNSSQVLCAPLAEAGLKILQPEGVAAMMTPFTLWPFLRLATVD